MKKNIIIIILTLILFLLISNNSYAMDEKSIVVLLDQLDLNDFKTILPHGNYGIGFINLKTKKPYSCESLYLSMAMGEKIGIESGHYKGLYKDPDGIINIIGFKDILESLSNKKSTKIDLLANRLKNKEISYIGGNSSAILAADNKGQIRFGQIDINYNERWLIDKTDYNLSNSNILILSYDIQENKERSKILKKYIRNFKDFNIILLPINGCKSMGNKMTKNLVPIIYLKGDRKGIIKSSSTNRKGFITLEDISVELLANNGQENPLAIGNKIDIVKTKNNLHQAKDILKKL